MVLWEFSTTLMPTSKGGPLVMLFALTKEGVPAGKTTAAVFYTIFLDTGFFVLLVPIITPFFWSGMLLPANFGSRALAVAGGVFWTTYAVMASYWILLAVLLLVRPQWVPVVFGRLARLRVLSRWKAKIEKLALDFSEAAIFMRKQPVRVHFHAIFGTLGAWTLKFAMINCLVLAIAPQVPVDGYTQMFIYARMVAMFLIMAFSPTPGGAGLAEIALPQFISDIIPTSLGLVVALIWRGMAYYGYIIAGAIVVPAWVSKWGK